jgi:hypothetical protein
MISFSRVSSGVKGLDEILNYQQTDDNVVMQVDDTPDAGAFDSAGVVFISIFLDAAPFNVLQFHNEVAQSFFGRY